MRLWLAIAWQMMARFSLEEEGDRDLAADGAWWVCCSEKLLIYNSRMVELNQLEEGEVSRPQD